MGVRFFKYGAGALTVDVVAGGIASCRGLASQIFLCLTARDPAPRSSASRDRTIRPTASLLASSFGSDVDEKGADFVRDDDRVKHAGSRRIDSP